LSGNAVSQQPAQSVAPSIAGYWTSADGATYAIAQTGNYVVFQGYSAGTLAIVGNGQVAGSSLTLQTLNLWQRAGVLSLAISPNLRQLSGQYTDKLTNQSYPIQIFR
jgi:hypothetical protein